MKLIVHNRRAIVTSAPVDRDAAGHGGESQHVVEELHAGPVPRVLDRAERLGWTHAVLEPTADRIQARVLDSETRRDAI